MVEDADRLRVFGDAPTLEAKNVTLGYAAAPVIQELSLTIPSGEVSVIVGANGCGKSTLLRGLGRFLKPKHGAVLLDGKDLTRYSSKELARLLGFLPQNLGTSLGMTVRELVSCGRYPHRQLWGSWSQADETAVQWALAATDTTEFSQTLVDDLSGGQRQRVWLAVTLAQQTPLVLLDEPTTYLDVAHQMEVLETIARLNAEHGVTVIMVLHDLNSAVRYGNHMIALRRGELVAEGNPRTVVNPQMVWEVFHMEADVVPDPVTGDPLVIPRASGSRKVG